MQWRVVGATRDNGKDVELIIDALTQAAAEQEANRLGVLVEEVEPLRESEKAIRGQQQAQTGPSPSTTTQWLVKGLTRDGIEDVEVVVGANTASVAETLAKRGRPRMIVQSVEPFREGRAARVPPAGPPYARRANAGVARRSSGLGIASCVLGVVSLLICWFPLLRILALGLGTLAIVLGIIGLITATVRQRTAPGFPMAGTVVAGVALVIVVAQGLFLSMVPRAMTRTHRMANGKQQVEGPLEDNARQEPKPRIRNRGSYERRTPPALTRTVPRIRVDPVPALTPTEQRRAIDVIMLYPDVLDAAITQKGRDLRLGLVVAYGTDKARARQLGDNFIRSTKTFADAERDPRKEIGTGVYDYLVGVYLPNEVCLVMGAKSRIATRVSW